jgi:hypothetical protein
MTLVVNTLRAATARRPMPDIIKKAQPLKNHIYTSSLVSHLAFWLVLR